MRKRRGGIAAATIDGRIVVAGGEEAAGTIGEVEAYEPEGRRWRYLPRLPTPRHGLGVASYGGRIFVLEGGPEPGLFYSDVVEALRVAPQRVRSVAVRREVHVVLRVPGPRAAPSPADRGERRSDLARHHPAPMAAAVAVALRARIAALAAADVGVFDRVEVDREAVRVI